MNFFEKLVEAGKEKGFENATQLFAAAGVSTNAQVSCKKTGNLSDANKLRLAKALGISTGDINRMKADALREQNAEVKKSAELKKEGDAVAVDEALAEEPEVVDLNAIPVPDEICYEPQAATEPRDAELTEKIDKIMEKNLDYHDRLQLEAEKELQAEYAQMLRAKMQEKVRCDLEAACGDWLSDHKIETAVDMLEIVTELLSLEKETK